MERFLVLFGCLLLAFAAWTYFEAAKYQSVEMRRFEKTVVIDSRAGGEPEPAPERPARPAVQQGSPVSRMEIRSISLSVVVVEGVAPRNLIHAAGHIPGTAFPGEIGNVGIAGHRDTFFRGLRKVRPEDRISLTTSTGTYDYSVESTKIVEPTDVQVLAASNEPVLTLVTCYPFYFVGPAPKRYIVRARRIEGRVPAEGHPAAGLSRLPSDE
jgi:sortase A